MIFQASLANAQILIPSNQASVSSMLLEGRTLLALATTMYAPGGIDQVLCAADCWYILGGVLAACWKLKGKNW